MADIAIGWQANFFEDQSAMTVMAVGKLSRSSIAKDDDASGFQKTGPRIISQSCALRRLITIEQQQVNRRRPFCRDLACASLMHLDPAAEARSIQIGIEMGSQRSSASGFESLTIIGD